MFDPQLLANGRSEIMNDFHTLFLKNLGINTHKEAIAYMRPDCHICRSEGFDAQARIKINYKNHSILATLNMIESDLLRHNEIGLSTFAWDFLNAKEGDTVRISHPKMPESLSYIRSKIYGNELNQNEIDVIVKDISDGELSDIHISAFLAAAGNGRLNKKEITYLTQSMVKTGNVLTWEKSPVVDKHCVGGVPGNRTSLITVPIVAACGLMIPKTSSRAITSPAGTADTMEVLAPVTIDLKKMQKIVERENACIIWGGGVSLSPVDDILIRIERALVLDSEGQLVASILSKKMAAGSSHVLIDIPIGLTAKVRSIETANLLKYYLESIGEELGLHVEAILTDGTQPIGRGIGPALEAKDVLKVLQNDKTAPQDLREHALVLAGKVLEFSSKVKLGEGKALATTILESGQAWEKFQAICQAQGGMFEPPTARHTHTVLSKAKGMVTSIDNRFIAQIAKLAGAPHAKAAGVELLTPVGSQVTIGQPLFIIHSEASGELDYAKNYLKRVPKVIQIKENE